MHRDTFFGHLGSSAALFTPMGRSWDERRDEFPAGRAHHGAAAQHPALAAALGTLTGWLRR
jgi:hypothetical protein